MLRTSCLIFIRQCHKKRLIDDKTRKELEEAILKEEFHCELRNLLMMVLVPRPLHEDGERQAAYLRATVSRVRFNFIRLVTKHFKIVNPTVMQSKGLDFLRPIWRLIYSETKKEKRKA